MQSGEGFGEPAVQQTTKRVQIKRGDGAEQLIVDSGDERHRSSGNSGHDIGSAHRRSLEHQDSGVPPRLRSRTHQPRLPPPHRAH